MRIGLILLVATVICSPSAVAQNDGDVVVATYASGTSNLLLVTPQGVIATLFTRPSTYAADGLTAAPGNDGGVLAERDSTTKLVSLLKFQSALNITTLATLSSTFTRVPMLEVDAGGDILILNGSGTDRGVYRMPGKGGPLTTIAHNTTNASFMAPFAMAEDVMTGDLVVLDMVKLHRIDRLGQVTTLRMGLPVGPSISMNGNVHVDYSTGLMHLTYLNYIMSLDPHTGTITSLIQPTATFKMYFYGIDDDPFSGAGYYLSAYQTTPTPVGRHVMRYDPRTTALSTVATIPGTPSLTDVVTWHSRMLGGLTRPAWGQAYGVRLAIPSEAGQAYFAGAAFGALVGIPLGKGRRIPLDPDPLFFFSLNMPALFSNFQGVLNAQGTTMLTVNIPALPQLVGYRFFLAAITYGVGGVRVITEPLGVTVE